MNSIAEVEREYNKTKLARNTEYLGCSNGSGEHVARFSFCLLQPGVYTVWRWLSSLAFTKQYIK
jgi:hypothetical protein